jgi:hypothetical protein
MVFKKTIYDTPTPVPVDGDNNYAGRYRYGLCRFAWRIIKTPIFDTFIMLLILLSTLILATDSHLEECAEYPFQLPAIYRT